MTGREKKEEDKEMGLNGSGWFFKVLVANKCSSFENI
jgi:hypothetical protein